MKPTGMGLRIGVIVAVREMREQLRKVGGLPRPPSKRRSQDSSLDPPAPGPVLSSLVFHGFPPRAPPLC